jgi:pimeloyl-ACP methyl ester carboxylesterase
MISTDFLFHTEDETLSAFKTIAENGNLPNCLLLHGAGKSDKERLRPIAIELARIGISSIGFDYSGAGSSTLNIPTSISKRTQEADVAIRLLDHEKPMILCGFSMSGQVVIDLLKKHNNVSHIILFAP